MTSKTFALSIILLVLMGLLIFLFSKKEEPEVRETATTTDEGLGERVMGPEEESFKPGETKELTGLTLTFNELVEDYRCGGEDCPEAGAVTVNVTLKAANQEETRNLASDEVPFVYEGYAISITNVEPEIKTGEEIAKEDYEVTFRVAPTAIGENI